MSVWGPLLLWGAPMSVCVSVVHALQRRGLSEAEKRRQEDLQQEQRGLQKQLKDLHFNS